MTRLTLLSRSSWLSAWLRESGVLIASQVSAVATGSLLLVLIARELGPSNLGLFASFYGVAQAASAVVELGLTTWLLRELAATWFGEGSSEVDPSRRSALMSSAVGLSTLLAASLLGAGLLAGFAASLEFDEAGALLALLGYSSMLAVAFVLEVGFRARRRVRPFAVATLIEKLTLAALVSGAVALHAGIVAISCAYLIAGAVRLIYDATRLRGQGGIALHPPSLASIWRTARAAAPFAFNTAVVVIMPRLDVVLVATTTTVAAGYYAVADRALAGLLVAPVMALLALYPHLVGRPERIRQSWKLALGLAAPVAVVAGLAAVFAPEVVRLLFGERYAPAAPALQILMLSAPALIYSHTLLVSLFTERREKAVVLCVSATMVLGTGLFAAGLALDGITGAAWGAVARSALFMLTVFAFTRVRPSSSRAAAET